jgi:membrane-associated protein
MLPQAQELHSVEIFLPENIIGTFGLLGAGIVIFAETGLFFGFFLPGDTLILTAGVFASQGYYSFAAMFFVLAISAIVGDIVGYFSGQKMGAYWFTKKESFFFKRGYIEKAEHFYNKYGIATIVVARFVPIVRTFAPIIAGVIKMKYSTFIFYNIFGALLWVLGIGGLGYFLGGILPQNTILHGALVAFIFISIITPLVPRIFNKFFNKKPETTEVTEEIK